MKSALEELIESLERGARATRQDIPEASKIAPPEPREEHPWSPASVEAEQRFRQPHARLFPSLGRKVPTPGGPGTLLQVFANRVTVLLDSEVSRCSFFAPGEIDPISREFSG